MSTTLSKPDSELTEAEFTRLLFSNAKAARGVARIYGFDLLYHTYRSFKSPTGFPDWVLIRLRDKRLIVVETKTEKGKPSGEQEKWLDGFSQVGIENYLWKPSDLSDGEVVKVLAHDGPIPPGTGCDRCHRVFVHRHTCGFVKDQAALPIT